MTQPAPPDRAALLDDIIRTLVREELAKSRRSAAELGRVIGIEQGPAYRRLRNDDYAWKLSDLVLISEWLGVDIVGQSLALWKLVMDDGEAIVGEVRAGSSESSLSA